MLSATAIQESDDERVFETSLSWQRAGASRALDFELEYHHTPAWSWQLGLSSERVGGDEPRRERGIELEIQHGLIDPDRAGIGLGLSATCSAQRQSGADQRMWQRAWTLAVPVSARVAQGWVHVNIGVENISGDGSRPWLAVATQQRVSRSVDLLAEVAAVQRREHLAHAGMRWWLRRDKHAIDITVGRRGGEDGSSTLLTLGWSLMDLSF
ncbi:hypothetical protein [Piscinibacter terrae]|uniref:hypothetical protein n=1 Tax=Piscinibacter terrae TaxID=2496871 RepID=UPI000F59BB21|nr:hypothetical protein [Albitalea terrae]